jgi:GT2 family glycosyltransferase
MPKVSVIIVNFNTSEILEDCLTNLRGKYANMEVIVVDNGSDDDSVQKVKELFPDVILVESVNAGLAAGSNKGLDIATGDYLLYLGSDAFPEDNTILGVVGYFEHNPKVGAATCKLETRDGKLDMDSHRGFPTPWSALTNFSKLNKLFPKSKLFNQYFMGWEDMNSPHEIDLCISHFLMIRRSIFDRVGRWDEDYFVYGEDVDMCYRIKESGWKIMYLPQWKAVHYKGASVGTRKETADVTKANTAHKIRMRRETVKAMKLFVNKHLRDKESPFLIWLMYFAMFLLSNLRIALLKINSTGKE